MQHPARFTLRREHLALLKGMDVEWDTSPGAGCPMFRPGNPYAGGDPLESIVHLAGLPAGGMERVEDEEGRFSHHRATYPPGVIQRAHRLHQETATALAVVLSTQQFQPGTYVRDLGTWKLER